jgi:HK97 family phage prohead protease
MSKTRQTRSVTGTVEYRAMPLGDTVADSGKLSGVAIRFNSPTQIGDPQWGFREEFAPGAFTKTLQERDVVLLDNHDQSRPIARKSAGTLRVEQTEDSLRWNADPADTSYARDVQANIKAKNYGGCSVGFRAIKEDWTDDEGKPSDAYHGTRRIVREAELPEFSVVTFPAYGDTELSARDLVSAAREARADATAANSTGANHGPMTGTHSHSHPNFGADGDTAHTHEHSHYIDANHDHIHLHPDNESDRSADPKPESSTSEIDIREFRFRLLKLER